jgi:monoamine oxidase
VWLGAIGEPVAHSRPIVWWKRSILLIHFGGEHTSTYSQGYLNGGVGSGERCAREVLQAVRARS